MYFLFFEVAPKLGHREFALAILLFSGAQTGISKRSCFIIKWRPKWGSKKFLSHQQMAPSLGHEKCICLLVK